MSEPLIPMTPTDGVDDAADRGRKKQFVILGGVGAAALLGIGGFLLLSGGSSDSADATFTPAVHHAAPAATASPSASASSADQKVLPVYHGSVGDRDPFLVPAAVQAATAPATEAPAAAATPAASTAPAAGVTTTVTGAGGTTVSVIPGSGSTPTTVTVQPPAYQWLQLLASHHQKDGSWTVDVRTATGEVKGVKSGTKNVAGTLFYYSGEDETSGKPSFVFQLGESMGANLTPNAKESTKVIHADKSTVVLKNGIVDGGIYAD